MRVASALLWCRVFACLGAIALLPASKGIAACDDGVPVVTCTGDELNGVPNPPDGTTTLNVHSLTTNIAPPGGTRGIEFSKGGSATIIINFTDDHIISTSNAEGIFGQSVGNNGGSPFLGDGDPGGGGGPVTILSQGAVNTAGAAGIFAASQGGNGGGGSGPDGAGGAGGAGGHVTVTVEGAVSTTLNRAPGIAALSTAGRGGNGGTGFIIAPGDGAVGGTAGNILVNSRANVTTTGDELAGILARSVGGGGGNGGSGIAFEGSTGGPAGHGGTVKVDSTSPFIATGGLRSHGIQAQSIGGFAGSGGASTILFLGFGGNGESGGNANNVEVLSHGTAITAAGPELHAILAQSIGGGGGSGGIGGGLIAFGGGASPGGAGGEVFVQNSAALTTTQDGSTALVAQSVGGGGGSGGTAGGVVAIGGSGGGGGDGRRVEVQNSGKITVSGNGAGYEFGNYGIFAQSIGGGGGSANISGGVVTIGGTGGGGGAGGDVVVTNSGEGITGTCDGCRDAGAIYAQSVGGGGGRGGSVGGIAAIGGTAGGGGSAGTVTVNNDAALVARGQFSRGIFAQSVGGGGGDGGFGGGLFTIGGSGEVGGDGRAVSVRNTGDISTTGHDSAGIFAQSVGGGGGSGGNTLGVGVFASVAIGGSGAGGGKGDRVEVNKDNTASSPGAFIQTNGDRSAGILAQSVGGGGGNGGFAIGVSGGPFASATLTVGGSGEKGGSADEVYVGANGEILTRGSFSSGIVAESVGGGGGSGGFAVSVAGSNGGAASLSFGGTGGPGGAGGVVTVNNFAKITTGCTTCTQSHGILASSIGGGGGSGGFAVSGGVGGSIGALGLSFGGNGGEGNEGRDVTVTSSVAHADGIRTFGDMSHGILAQSIGGGGGSGGFSGTLSLGLTGAAPGLAFGGDGGEGGFAGAVTVNNTGNITTSGQGSYGILAQSIGGGGGNGGFAGALSLSAQGNAAAAAFGGTAAEGQEGRAVEVRHNGVISTTGDNAIGILAQSIGGGGGTGGFALSATGSLDQGASALSVGGKGGDGGKSGTVLVTDVFGSITTRGEQAHGILAQSIAGGGGNGGFSISAGFSLNSDTSASAIGGAGGSGQISNTVTVDSSATITTGGDGGGVGSHGIFAQSVGGGGGSGGFSISGAFSLEGNASSDSVGGRGGSGNDADKVTVTSRGAIRTQAANSYGIFAQSVGGGGGSGAFSITANASVEADAKATSVGGSGGAGGNGGEVEVNVLANITTTQNLSHGVLAQSVGGGGGNGGFSLAAGIAVEGNSSVSSVGGKGSGGGNGDTVTVNVGSADGELGTPEIHTHGEGSIGVFAQSVGGGGGNGGFSGGLVVAPSGTAENSVGGRAGTKLNDEGVEEPFAGAGGDGGEVYVNNWGKIVTEKSNAAGILAQSVGGGGGNGGFSIAGTLGESGGPSTTGAANNAIGGSAGGGGKGLTVQVQNFGIIETKGDFSHGILAQSVGGGGGNGGFAINGSLTTGDGGATSSVGGGAGGGGGQGGNVIVENSGSITVGGKNAFGVFAQSVGGGGGSGGFAGGLALGGTMENAVGGAGAQGGHGGDVTVTSTGSIVTTADNSSAVFAQSIGGGGGWGGFAIGLGTGGGSTGLKLGIGTDGLSGVVPVDGKSGTVTVTIDGGTTQTAGSLSYGLLAQAIAGGGGAGGTVVQGLLSFIGSNVEMTVGSSGFMPGDGTLQDTTYANNTTTTGLGSTGLIAQSIGGGGGVDGLVIGDELELNPSGLDDFFIDIGGYAGGFLNSGSGGGFKLTAQGTVTTENDNAMGIVAQTIGGGGGIGNITINTVTNNARLLQVMIGGSQIAAGHAGQPADGPSTVTAEQEISTQGDLSHGLVAQSIGGGGGISNIVFQNGVTITGGARVVLGGIGAAGGGDGGDVTATAEGDVTTAGAGAFGIIAQSIGGGGGLAGLSSNGLTFGDAAFTLGATSGAQVTVEAGDAADGSGATTTVVAGGNVRTSGFGAHGIVAQSVGGGGGIVGAGLFSATTGTDAFAGSAGGTGNGGDVNVTTRRNVVVTGEDAYGIFGQSAGGAPGAVSITVDKSGNGVGLVWASHGSGAAVQFMNGASNALETDGTLYAQGSIADLDPATLPALDGLAIAGTTGSEAITNLAYVFAAEPDPELVPFGYGADYGVLFNISSGIDPETGLDLFTIGTRTSNVIGNVDLGEGDNRFENANGALFITEAFVNMANGGAPQALASGGVHTLTNAGLLSPGDRGRVQVTAVDGNVFQTDAGKFFVDVDLDKQVTPPDPPDPLAGSVVDRLELTGSASMAGEAPLLLMSINKKFNEYVIIDAQEGGTIDDNGLTPRLIPDAVGFDFGVRVATGADAPDGDDLILFADKPPFGDLLRHPDSGTRDPNVFRMGEGIDRIETTIGTDDPFNYLVNLLRLSPDHKTLGDAVVTLTPHNAPHIYEITQRRAQDFVDATIDCPSIAHAGIFADRRNCLWVHGSYGDYERGSVRDSPLNKDQWSAFTIGAQAALDQNWQLGLGFEATNVDSKQTREGTLLSTLDGDLYHGSVSANYKTGGFAVGFVSSVSRGLWDSRRNVNVDGVVQQYTSFDGIGSDGVNEFPIFSNKTVEFEGISGVAKSKPELTSFTQLLRFSYTSELNGGVQVMPFFDVEGHISRSKRRTETGVGLADLTYPSVTETAVTLTPGVQLGVSTRASDVTLVSAFVRGGVRFAPDNTWSVETQFVAAPDGLPPIRIKEEFEDVLFELDAGIALFSTDGFDVRANYSGAFGDDTTEHAVQGGVSFRF